MVVLVVSLQSALISLRATAARKAAPFNPWTRGAVLATARAGLARKHIRSLYPHIDLADNKRFSFERVVPTAYFACVSGTCACRATTDRTRLFEVQVSLARLHSQNGINCCLCAHTNVLPSQACGDKCVCCMCVENMRVRRVHIGGTASTYVFVMRLFAG